MQIVFGAFVLRYLRSIVRHIRARGLRTSIREIYYRLARRVFSLIVTFVPSARKQLRTELGNTEKELKTKLAPYDPSLPEHHRLPAEGLSAESIEHELESLGKLHAADWQHGRVSGAVYHGHGKVSGRQIDLGSIIESAMHKTMLSNPLHPDGPSLRLGLALIRAVFPGVRRMEAEVIRMCLNSAVLMARFR